MADAPPRNQPPRNTISLSALIKAMTTQVTVRNAGVAEEDQYAPDDPAWDQPAVPPCLDAERPLSFEDVLAGDPGTDEDDLS